MTAYVTRIAALIVKPKGEPIFSEMATTIEIEDESGGLFVVVKQMGRGDIGKVAIDPCEWPQIRDAIDKMLSVCADIEAEKKGHPHD